MNTEKISDKIRVNAWDYGEFASPLDIVGAQPVSLQLTFDEVVRLNLYTRDWIQSQIVRAISNG